MKIGDRVTRTIILENEVVKHGVIVDKYESTHNHINQYIVLYSIKWDGSELIEKGYMEFGLKKENK